MSKRIYINNTHNKGKTLTVDEIDMICETVFTISKIPFEHREQTDRLVCVALNEDQEPLNIELVHTGPINEYTVTPEDILRTPLARNAAKIVVIHEFLEDDDFSEMPDSAFLSWLLQACLIMRMPLLDYVVVGRENYFSFKEAGLLDEWINSSPYQEPFTSED